MWFDVGAVASRYVGDHGMGRIATYGRNTDLAVSGAICLVGIERNASTVMRPGWPPSFEVPFCELSGLST